MTKAEVNSIIERAERDYIACDGLMSLGANNFKPSYRSGPFDTCTVDNDNGHLWLALYWVGRIAHGSAPSPNDNTKISQAMSRCQVKPGLYHRNPGRADSLNSIDNYCALATLEAIQGAFAPTQIVGYGRNNGWVFNNVEQGKWRWSAWRQPSDRAHYKVAAGYKPNWFEWLWLGLGLEVNALQNKSKTSEHTMSWLRLWTLARMGQIDHIAEPAGYWLDHATRKYGSPKGLLSEFFGERQDHPCVLLAPESWLGASQPAYENDLVHATHGTSPVSSNLGSNAFAAAPSSTESVLLS